MFWSNTSLGFESHTKIDATLLFCKLCWISTPNLFISQALKCCWLVPTCFSNNSSAAVAVNFCSNAPVSLKIHGTIKAMLFLVEALLARRLYNTLPIGTFSEVLNLILCDTMLHKLSLAYCARFDSVIDGNKKCDHRMQRTYSSWLHWWQCLSSATCCVLLNISIAQWHSFTFSTPLTGQSAVIPLSQSGLLHLQDAVSMCSQQLATPQKDVEKKIQWIFECELQ